MKKGFIFMETLIVLVVLMVTVVGMYGMFVRLSTDIENRKYYDNISDLYKTDILRSEINKSKLTSTSSLIEITKNNCSTYMSSSCASIMTSLNADKIIINIDSIESLILSENNGIKNSMREYLKTINKNGNNRYIIVNYKNNDKNYYASLRI